MIEELHRSYRLPPDVHAEDVGTSIREVLFDVALSEKRPARLILVDTINKVGKKHGEVLELGIGDLTENKITDYSMHQFPTSNMLREIANFCGVQVRIIAAQMCEPTEKVTMELSEMMTEAIPKAAKKAYELCLIP